MLKRIFTFLFIVVAFSNVTYTQTFTEIQEVLASDAKNNQQLGFSVDISGDYAVVGVPNDPNKGAAYIYYRDQGGPNNWGQVKKIIASDGASNDMFGFDVTIDGDNVAVGAHAKTAYTGNVYVFNRNQGGTNNWGQVKKLSASDAAVFKGFGLKVSLSGSTLIVGANDHFDYVTNPPYFSSVGPGGAYIFEQNNGGTDNWGQVKKIVASDGVNGDMFGYVDIQGDYAAVGAIAKNSNMGAAYLYYRNQGGANNWGQIKKLTPSVGTTIAPSYGLGISIFGDNVAVGGYYENGSNGVVYVYNKNQGGTNNWGEVKRFTGSTVSNYYWFGTTLSLYNDILVVGASGYNSNAGTGKVYAFKKDQGGTDNWGETQVIAGGSDSNYGDQFGSSVSLYNKTLIVGAILHDHAMNMDNGSAYIFEDCHSTAASSINVSPSNTICSGSSVTLTVNGGALGTGASWHWYTGSCGGTSAGTGNSITVSPTSSTTYYVRAEGGCNTTACVSTTVTVNTVPTASASSNSPVCSGSSINLTANTVSGATYSWSGPGGYSSSSQNPTISNASSGDAGTYTLTVTRNGCSSNDNVSVIVNPSPTAGASSNSPVCEGDNIQLSGSSLNLGATYSWSGPGGYSSSSQNPTISNASSSDAGTYTLTVTDNGCSSNDNVSVIVNPNPSASASSNSPVCEGGNIQLSGSSLNLGATYSWSGPGTYSSSSQNPTISNASSSDAGTYTLTVTDNGCSSNDNVSVIVNPNPIANASSNSPVCEGDNINLTANTVSGATYSWSSSGGYTSNSQNPTITNATSSDAGTYTLTVTHNGCSSNDNVSVIVNPNPLANASSNSPVCEGDDINLTANTVSGATYSWSSSGGYSSNSQNPTITNATSSDAGTYTLTVTNNGCSSNNDVSVVVDPNEDASFTYSPNTICIGSPDVTPIISGDPGGTFTTSNTDLVINPSTGEINMSSSLAGTYNVTYTTSGTCFDSETHSVTITSSPDATFSYPNTEYCQDAGTIAPVFPSGSSAGTFSSTNGLELDPNSGDIDLTLSNPGTYIVTNSIAASGVCPANSADYTVTVKETPTVTVGIASTSTLCPGSTLDLEASGAGSGGSYNWTGPNGFNSTNQNPSISNADISASGYYIVTITNGVGCSNVDSVNVNIVDSIAPTFNNGCIGDTILYSPDATCEIILPDFTSSSQLNITDNCGNVSSNTLTISQNPSAGTTLDIGSHTVWIIVSDNSNNADSCSFNITVVDTIAPSFTGGCLNDTILTANSASCDIQLPDFISGNPDLNSVTDNCSSTADSSITFIQNPANGTVLTPGDHTIWIIATDAYGNADSCSFVVTVEGQLPEFPVLTANNYSVCVGSSVVMEVDSPNNTNNYTWIFNGEEVGTGTSYEVPSATSADQGMYIITAESPNGCKADTSTYLTVEICDITISGAISPNDDGKNDNFVIDGLAGYPNTKVWIYNRWGTKVFNSDDYQNDWNGTSQSGMNIGGDQLPEGTYYYIIQLGGKEGQSNQGKEYTGYVYLKR